MSTNLQRLCSSLVLAAALAVSATGAAAQICGDINESGDVTASDALSVLRSSVGQQVSLKCGFTYRYGEPDDFNQTVVLQPDYLQGELITIPQDSTVTHLGLTMRKFGPYARMALYTDESGSPGTLVTGTLETEMLIGSQEIAVQPKQVKAGTYWIMANFDMVAEVGGNEQLHASNVIKYRQQDLSAGNPGVFGPALEYTGTKLNFWVRVEN